ncbi:MAG TPA: hypothetical protein VE961_14860 [Pyrinomonadaceae bacterium]|nr:hypothetical protein [Pyrinomonadaceae bacterium]
MAKDQIQWASPPPLWPHATSAADAEVRRRVVRRPEILRFASDDFMNDVVNLLEQDPARLVEKIAVPETWRGPTPAAQAPAPVPLFARTMNRLGLSAARAKNASLIPGGKGISSLIATTPPPQYPPFKLYQPAHQRFYLIASALVCQRAGLPDHAINPGRQESATFVLRRMFPPGKLDITVALPDFNASTWEEYAFIAATTGNSWRRIPKTQSSNLSAGEEQLPLFPLNYVQDDAHKRRVLAGLIPVGKREAYMAAGFQKQPGDDDPVEPIQPAPDPRMHLFWSKVTEPWKKLIEQASVAVALNSGSPVPTTVGDPIPNPTPLPASKLPANLKSIREQIQTGSWYIVLDFANLLMKQTPRVWRLLNGQGPAAGDAPFNADESALVDAITNTTFDNANVAALTQDTSYVASQVKGSLKDALIEVKNGDNETNLENLKTSYDRTKNPTTEPWPQFLFPLADPVFAVAQVNPKTTDRDQSLARVDALAALIEKALPAEPADEVPVNPLISQQPMDMREGWYVIRCVFERPACGPIDPPLLSDPSREFQMAGFFDPDAPARPIRIALPIDTSPAGLRKFDKNTAFMISDMLCGQINRVKGMTLADLVLSVLPWPFHKDLSVPDGGPCSSGGIEFGMMCSLSIPIITICALLMLMIIVSLLDIIFRWMPFFIFCFPLPKFNSKS